MPEYIFTLYAIMLVLGIIYFSLIILLMVFGIIVLIFDCVASRWRGLKK